MTEPASLGRRLTRFASYNVGQQVWLALLSVVATPILYRELGAAAYGLLAIVNLVAAQLAILEFGFGHATIRRLAQDASAHGPARISGTVATSSWVFLAAAAAGAAVVLGATDVLAEQYFQIPAEDLATGKAALRIGAAFFVVSILSNLAGAVFQGLQRFGYLNFVSGLAATAQIGGSVALVLWGFGVLHVLVWSVVLGVLGLAVHVWRLRREVPGVRLVRPPDGGAFREMAGFGFLIMLSGLFTQVFLSGGGLLLGYHVVVSALPLFTIPFGLFQRLNRMGYGLASALYPLVAEMDGLRDRPSMTRLFVSGTRMLLVLGTVVMVPGILLASPFLTLWMGPEFSREAGPVLELLLAAFVLSLATVPSVELARGTGRAWILVVYSATLAGVNLIGVALMAPTWGPMGAGAAFLLAQTGGAAVIVTLVGRRACLRVPSLRMGVFLAAGVVGSIWALDVTTSLAGRAAAAGVMGAVLASVGLGWTLSGDERRTLRRVRLRT